MKIERIAMAAALVSALAASACPQSDKSTPEGTVKSFQTARRAFEDANLFYQIQETLNKVEEPYITDPLKEKRKVALAKTKEYIAEKQNYKTDSCESAKNEDGSVSVVIKDSYEQKGTDPASGKQETKTRSETFKFLMKKSGEEWRISESYSQCFGCEGTGSCRSCKGTGEMSGSPCYLCKGKKSCSNCEGSKWKRDDYDKMEFEFLLPADEFKPAMDNSTAQKAAETYANVLIMQAIEMSKTVKKTFDDVVKVIDSYFSPEVTKTVHDQIAKAVENGKAAFGKLKVEVKSFKEIDQARASAVVMTPPNAFSKSQMTEKIILKKVSDKWLVDDVMHECWGCKGTGECSSCKGTGKFGDEKCYACNEDKKCSSCKGEGYQADK